MKKSHQRGKKGDIHRPLQDKQLNLMAVMDNVGTDELLSFQICPLKTQNPKNFLQSEKIRGMQLKAGGQMVALPDNYLELASLEDPYKKRSYA